LEDIKMKKKIIAFLTDTEKLTEFAQDGVVFLVIAANFVVLGALGYMAACFVLAAAMN